MSFTPKAVIAANNGGTYVLNCTAANASITLPAGFSKARVLNAGPNTVFVEIGPTAYEPTGATEGTNTGSTPLLAGAGSIPMLIDKAAAVTISGVCTAAQTAKVYITMGNGEGLG